MNDTSGTVPGINECMCILHQLAIEASPDCADLIFFLYFANSPPSWTWFVVVAAACSFPHKISSRAKRHGTPPPIAPFSRIFSDGCLLASVVKPPVKSSFRSNLSSLSFSLRVCSVSSFVLSDLPLDGRANRRNNCCSHLPNSSS